MLDFSKLTKTTKLSETQFYSVKNVTKDSVVLINDTGGEVNVNKKYAEECLISSDQVQKEEKLSRTDLANIFLSNPGVILTVNYNKKVDEKEVKKELAALYPNKGGKILSEKEYVAKVNSVLATALQGEERTMVGRHNGIKDDFGRVHFIDMEADASKSTSSYDARHRLVDPRTINWLILRGTKYIVK